MNAPEFITRTGEPSLKPGGALDVARWSSSNARKLGVALLTDDASDSGIAQGVYIEPVRAVAMQAVESVLMAPVQWIPIDPDEFEALLSAQEHTRMMADEVIESGNLLTDADSGIETLSLEALETESNPVVKAVNAAIYDALRLGASDVHFESIDGGIRVRFRIDGVMANGPTHQGRTIAPQVISRLKVMSELDIGETRVPQDGRILARALGRMIDFRLSIMPSAFGEDAALRLLDKRQITQSADDTLRLQALGFDTATLKTLRYLARLPYGMLLVTGPTGSGKTTTLYSMISEVFDGSEKIITIEDPIEYQLEGVLQIPVNEKRGLTFAKGLRSILRHDPDRIMVGEIRDLETAEIAIQSALTGHAVFTTVHANNIFDVVGRFTHMDVDLMNFVSALNGIVAQRLVRTLCEQCKQSVDVSTLLNEDQNHQEWVDTLKTDAVFKPVGCSHCRNTGYKGRVAVAEYLVLNDDFRELIRQRAPHKTLRERYEHAGLERLRQKVMRLVAQGVTSVEECNRVTVAELHN